MSAEAIAQAFNGFGKVPIQVFPVTVKSVEGKTCTVTPADAPELELDEVVLQASADAENGLTITPKAGTAALVGLISNSPTTLYLIACDEVEKVEFATGETKVSADADGVNVERSGVSVKVGSKISIKTQGGSLKDLFTELLAGIQKVVISTPAGPGSATFDFLKFNTKMGQILE